MTHGRRACKNGRPCEPRTIQEAIYCVVHHSGIDAVSIATRLNKRVGYLHDAANPDREDTHFQAALLLPLMQVTGNLEPLRFIARELSCAVVELPQLTAQPGDIRQKFLIAVKEIGEDAAELERALADNRITSDDALRLKRELSDTIEALIAVDAVVDRCAKGRVVA